MRALAFARPDFTLVTIGSAILVVLAVAIPLSGVRPYGEQAILEQIDHEDGTLCQKFGFAVSTPESADCMLDLADLRQRHVDLVQSYSWL